MDKWKEANYSKSRRKYGGTNPSQPNKESTNQKMEIKQ
jgi:hypothetical protein